MKIVIASDHGGYELKKLLTVYIGGLGHEVADLGCDSTDSVDYTDYGERAAHAVAEGRADRGILICSTGIGMSIAANKLKGIRCALCSDTVSARLTREHNDTNMMALGAMIIGPELAKGIVRTWLETEFSGAERHQRRIDKITALENSKVEN